MGVRETGPAPVRAAFQQVTYVVAAPQGQILRRMRRATVNG
ncbi:MAG TPA: hypothetical protein VFY14_17200 [Streptomyces sp.]|nr:hypothetical protein [Streptomyces sp.]